MVKHLIRTIAIASCAAFYSNMSVANDDVADALKYAMPITAATISYTKDDNVGLVQFGKSFGGAIVTTYALKQLISKERPNGEDDDAFPSGHATSAFASAAYLQKRYGKQYGIPAYALATYVAYSRVDNDHHEWGDVAAGAAIGIAFNQYFTSRYNSTNVQLSLSPTNGGAVLAFDVKL